MFDSKNPWSFQSVFTSSNDFDACRIATPTSVPFFPFKAIMDALGILSTFQLPSKLDTQTTSKPYMFCVSVPKEIDDKPANDVSYTEVFGLVSSTKVTC